jgi:ATP-dependent protease HslVU (ClpYQ) peptidase subunit
VRAQGREDGMAGDGQETLGNTVIEVNARKVRTI